MKWKNIGTEKPKESEKGTPVLVKLNTEKKLVYGKIVISIYYKGKFHKDFSRGYIQNVTYWMPLPKPPKE